jgi:glycosyltransferase involved in cell wall biosynthesis
MKIAQCLEYPIEQHGGTEALVRELIHGLSARHQIVLVSNDDTASISRSSVAGKIHTHIAWNPQRATRKDLRMLAHQLRDAGVDLAHFHFGGTFGWGSRALGSCPIIALGRWGIPVVTTVHSVGDLLDSFCGPQRPLWFKIALWPFAWFSKLSVLRWTRAEVAVSQQNLATLRGRYWPMRPKFRHIYHSRMRDEMKPGALAEREKTVLHAGHLGWRKGQPVLIEAFARVAGRFPDWELLLAGGSGDAETQARVEQLISQHALQTRVRLLGQRNDVPDLMRRAGIYVQPSIQEGLGLALQEALFLGCPCIGTRTGGIPELIADHENGLLVPPAEPLALAEALALLMENPSLRQQLASAARASVVQKGMTSPEMLRHYEAVYSGSESVRCSAFPSKN